MIVLSIATVVMETWAPGFSDLFRLEALVLFQVTCFPVHQLSRHHTTTYLKMEDEGIEESGSHYYLHRDGTNRLCTRSKPCVKCILKDDHLYTQRALVKYSSSYVQFLSPICLPSYFYLGLVMILMIDFLFRRSGGKKKRK